MPDATSSRPAADRNLLFGILALQMDFISRDALIEAMQAWVFNKSKTLGQILVGQGNLIPERLQLLEALVREHLRAHANDPQHSLAAVTPSSAVHQVLLCLGDEDLQASLAIVGAARAADSEATVHDSRAPRPGTLAGMRYRVLRPHAKGGLGAVSVAEDLELHREVALKEIQASHADNPDSRSRFLLEAEITGRLEHPGIVPVYGLGQYDDGRPFYAMRFIRGDNLKEAIRRFHASDTPTRDSSERSLAFRELLGRFVGVCNAVAYAHSRGILHRDLKPGNIMLGKYGETLVVDWGLSKAIDRPETFQVTEEATLKPSSGSGVAATQMGSAIGTPGYMSPEQAAGRLDLLGPASDIYSLGATLYALLTGQAPFREPEDSDLLAKVQRGELVPPRQIKAATPKSLEAICLKAMALRPNDRYATALELAADIEHWLADEPVAAYPEPWTVRTGRWGRRHRTALVAATVFLVSAVVALSASTALVWQEQRKTADQKQVAEDNYKLARQLSYHGVDLTTAFEVDLASVPALHSARTELLKAAAKAFRQYLDQEPDDPELRRRSAQVYRYTANIHRLRNETEAAEPLYLDAIRLYEGLADQYPEEAVHREMLSATLRDWSQLQVKVGHLQEATATLHRAREMIEELRRAPANRTAYHRTQSQILLDLSGVEYVRGLVPDSRKTAQGALERLRALAQLPAGEAHPYDPLLLAAAQNRLAAAERALGRLDAALEQHREAIKLLEGMRNTRPNQVNLADIADYLARCRLEQCRTWAMTPQRRANAEINLGATILQWEELAKGYLGIPRYREWLAVAYQTRGQLRADANRPDEARADFEAARTLLEELVKTYPQVAANRADLGMTYASLGRLARGAGNEAAAADWFRQAADALRQAVAQSPDDAEVGRSLKELETERAK